MKNKLFTMSYEELEQMLLDYLFEVGEIKDEFVFNVELDFPVSLNNKGNIEFELSYIPYQPELPLND